HRRVHARGDALFGPEIARSAICGGGALFHSPGRAREPRPRSPGVTAPDGGEIERRNALAVAGTAEGLLALAVPPEREPSDGAAPLHSGFREAWALLVDLRGAPKTWIALMLALGVLGVIILNMVAQVRLNTWQGDFFNAIEKKDLPGVGRQLLTFLPIAGVLLCLVVAQTWMHEMLKVRIRATVTRRLLDGWLAPHRAYRLGVISPLGVNPDQRLQEDVRHLAE